MVWDFEGPFEDLIKEEVQMGFIKTETKKKDEWIRFALSQISDNISNEGKMIWTRWGYYWVIIGAIIVLLSKLIENVEYSPIAIFVSLIGIGITLIWYPIIKKGWYWYRQWIALYKGYQSLTPLRIYPINPDNINGRTIFYYISITFALIGILFGLMIVFIIVYWQYPDIMP
jgi:hypothetical protein